MEDGYTRNQDEEYRMKTIKYISYIYVTLKELAKVSHLKNK